MNEGIGCLGSSRSTFLISTVPFRREATVTAYGRFAVLSASQITRSQVLFPSQRQVVVT